MNEHYKHYKMHVANMSRNTQGRGGLIQEKSIN